MPQILMPYTVHLDHTLRVTPLNTLFAKGDSAAHRFELTILRSGVKEDLTGCTVMCRFYRMADSAFVSVPGFVEDGNAVAVLESACYNYIGRFALTITIQKGDEATTVFYGDGYMHGQSADATISGEYIIYDINTLLEKISEIDAATRSANKAAEAANEAAKSANFVVLGQYDTIALLRAAHPVGSAGDAWAIGKTTPYDVYVWDVDKSSWTNVGPIQGAKGPKGDTGVGIETIERTDGDGSAGSVDTYTITYTDGTSTTYQVRNGANGSTELDENTLAEIMLTIYPVGAVYISTVSTSPSTLFGGTWERLKDTFLLCSGDKYPAGTTGGEAEHTLTVSEMPEHSHSVILDATGWGESMTLDAYTPYFASGTIGTTGGDGATGQYSKPPVAIKNGESDSHNNMPPYLAVYMWKRVA